MTSRLLSITFVASALALAVGAILTASPTEAAPRPVVGGHLDWGVKASFRSYVLGPIANGTITLTGATENGDGTFRFPAVSGTYDGNPDTFVQFSGSVQFVGHEGDLDMTISDLRIDFNGATGVVLGDMVSRDLQTGQFTTYPDIDLVDLTLTGYPPNEQANSVDWSPIPTFLTEEAEEAWEEFYFAPAEFDPIAPDLQLQDCGPTDSDGDGINDLCDTCPNWANPGQTKPSYALPAEDPDCDGFPSTTTASGRGAEGFIGTDPLDSCRDNAGDHAWPPDVNNSGQVNLTDVIQFGPTFNKLPPGPPYNPRFNLNGAGGVNLSDVIVIGVFFNKPCG